MTWLRGVSILAVVAATLTFASDDAQARHRRRCCRTYYSGCGYQNFGGCCGGTIQPVNYGGCCATGGVMQGGYNTQGTYSNGYNQGTPTPSTNTPAPPPPQEDAAPRPAT